MNLVEVDKPTDHERVLELEEKYISQLALIETKAGKDQWIQMNNLFSAQIEGLQDQIEDLQSQVNMLKSEVGSL